MNNPLTGILGYSDLLLSSERDAARTDKALQEIHVQSLRASKITKSLLDFVSAEQGYKKKVDINGLLRQALSLIEGRIKGGGISVDFQLAENALATKADPDDTL